MLKKILLAVLVTVLAAAMTGCMEKEIVKPQEAALVPDFIQAPGPVEIDWDQAYEGVDDLLSDKNEYPYGKYVSYMVYDDESGVEVLEMQWCVDDACVGEEAQKYGEIIVKAFNDELAIQDWNIRKSGEGDYGGYFDDHAAVVVIYHEAAEGDFQEAEVYQYIQPGSHAGIMQYIKRSVREQLMNDEATEE